MKFIRAEIQNFGSYKELTFDFSRTDLALVYGPTGSGKSTLQDIIPWILYGETSKGGKVDDVRSWLSDEPTRGSLYIEISTGQIEVVRVRGRSADNDLYWNDSYLQGNRGKDIVETQKLLTNLLGVDYSTFIASCCFNEFSPTGMFFTAKGKDRKELLENLADLSLAIKLAEKSSEHKKFSKKQLIKVENDLARLQGKIESLNKFKLSTESKIYNFDKEKSQKIKKLQELKDDFDQKLLAEVESYEASISELNKIIEDYKVETCLTCGATSGDDDLNKHIKNLEHLGWKLSNIKVKENPYIASIEETKSQTNLYQEQLDETLAELVILEENNKTNKQIVEEIYHKIDLLDTLTGVSSTLRMTLLQRSIKDIEESTNKYLEAYFDAELRVAFNLKDGDSLDVEINKNGHECTYKQLSKGQRQLLKLSFSLSVMRASANKVGLHFDNLFFDEALDGLDTSLKIKAFRIFEELSLIHKNILVIDHNEDLKNMFSRQLEVSINGDLSTVEEVYK